MELDGFCLGTAAFCHRDQALGQLLMFLKFIVGGDRLPRAAGRFLTRLLRDACFQATERGFSAPRPCRAPSGWRRRPGPAPRGGRAGGGAALRRPLPARRGASSAAPASPHGPGRAPTTCLRPRLALPAQLVAAPLLWAPLGPAGPWPRPPCPALSQSREPARSSLALALAWLVS